MCRVLPHKCSTDEEPFQRECSKRREEGGKRSGAQQGITVTKIKRWNSEQLWLFLFARNLKHWPICLLCLVTHTTTSALCEVTVASQFLPSLKFSGVWNLCLHTPMTTNVKTVPKPDSIVTLSTSMLCWSLGNNRWHTIQWLKTNKLISWPTVSSPEILSNKENKY